MDNCPPPPDCIFRVLPPREGMNIETPTDDNGCVIGCPQYVPNIETCGIAVERCTTDDDPECVRVQKCDNSDELVLARLCRDFNCVLTPNMEMVEPCSEGLE